MSSAETKPSKEIVKALEVMGKAFIDSSLFTYIGIIATSWATFELEIDMASLEIAKVEIKYGLCFTAQVIGPDRKLNAFIAVVKLAGVTSINKELDAFARETKVLSERRNRAVHDPLTIKGDGSGEGTRLEVTARMALRHIHVPTSFDNLSALAHDIKSHTEKFQALKSKIISLMPA